MPSSLVKLIGMETLEILKAHEQADACWKKFKERTLTKNAARENLLLDSDFDCLLKLLIGNCNERTRKVAVDFFIKCIRSKFISPVAFLTLIQQKIPQNSSSKSLSVPVIERLSRTVLEIEKFTGIDFSFKLALNDIRSIPFLIERLLSEPKLDLSLGLVNYLMGDPDLVLTTSVFDDPHYKISRCRVLTHLVNNVEDEDCAELLMTYLIWNSARPCILELEYLTDLIQFYSAPKDYAIVHVELFEVYLEVVCNVFFKYGHFSETVESICKLPEKHLAEISVFKIGSLLLLSETLSSDTAFIILQLLFKRENLRFFSKICCAKLLMKLNMTNELSNLMKSIFSTPSVELNISEGLPQKPITEFGVLVALGLKDLRPNSKAYEDYFDFIHLAKNFKNLTDCALNKFVERGHFEMIFSLLVFKWNVDDRTEVIKSFLKLLGNIENEDPEAKILRYSWVVDFFETNLTFEMYFNYLPLICEFVTNTDNVLFTFAQQKISQFISVKDNLEIQIPTILSLYVLFESSQSRQSRLNFLASTTLSFLHNLVTNNVMKIDTRAVFLAFKLLGLLCEIAVVDPRDIWTKYVEKIFVRPELMSHFHIRSAIFCISSSLRVIPDGSEGEINETKFKVIKLLIENLSQEENEFALDQICESLTKFSVETLRTVELSLLKPEPSEEEEMKEMSNETLLSKSNIFNPSLLYEISSRYRNGTSPRYNNLWTFLIDNEVGNMSRTTFLGSNETPLLKKSEIKTKAISNPFFFNGLVFETFSTSDCSNIENVIKCFRTQLMPLVPSINTLLWYIRPQLPDCVLEATGRIFNMIDDQRIKKQLCDFEFLLTKLRSGTTPQSLSTLLMATSAILKVAFINQIISENFLYNNWVEALTKGLDELAEFKSVLGNEEFLAAFAISCNILSGCSSEIDKCLATALDIRVLGNIKVRDGIAVYCAIEALSKSSIETVHKLLHDPKVSSKRKLVAIFAFDRLNLPVTNLTLPDIRDDISQIITILISRDKDPNFTISDPLEFKGISSYVQSLVSREELCTKSQQRAFDCGSVPAALKYDAIFAYLLSMNLDFLNMKLKRLEDINIYALEASTKDPKCLALLQFVSRSSSSGANDNAIDGWERFESLSWLKFVGLLNNEFKILVLTECKLLPRINWCGLRFEMFNFVLKHVLSITPITNVPYINPSMLTIFLEHVIKYVKSNAFDVKKTGQIVEILFNNSDERSVQILHELFDYSINECKDELLEILLLESVKYSTNNYDFTNLNIFNALNPQRTAKNLTALSKFCNHFGLKDYGNYLVDIKRGKSVFPELQNIIQYDCDESICKFKLELICAQVQELCSKERIRAAIDIIDLMFIHQQSKTKFCILSEIISEILNDIDVIILESKKYICEPEIRNKIRSRYAVLPKDICDRFETFFTSVDFEKEPF